MAQDLKISEFNTVHDMQGIEYIAGIKGENNTKIKPWELLEDYVRRDEIKELVLGDPDDGSGTGSSEIDVIDDLSSYSTIDALSANQGRILDTKKADINSPEFTGIPLAQTAPASTNSRQIATTEFVKNAISSSGLSTVPTYHADISTKYGEANTSEYGHVKVINDNGLTVSNGVLSMRLGTTSVTGTLQLTDSVSSTSTTTATTPANVKTAYDLANGALPKSGGTMTGVLYGQANTLYSTPQVRNIYATTTDLIAGSSSLTSGSICLVYE